MRLSHAPCLNGRVLDADPAGKSGEIYSRPACKSWSFLRLFSGGTGAITKCQKRPVAGILEYSERAIS